MIGDHPIGRDRIEQGIDLHEVRLGDATSNHESLRQCLPALADSTNSEASGWSIYRVCQILSRAGKLTARAWSASVEAIEWGIARFTDIESKRVLSRAEAEKIRVTAKAEADKIRITAEAEAEKVRVTAMAEAVKVVAATGAEAELTKAEAGLLRAKAEVLRDHRAAVADRIRVESKLEIIARLRELGIDWHSELEGDVLKVFFTKRTPNDLPLLGETEEFMRIISDAYKVHEEYDAQLREPTARQPGTGPSLPEEGEATGRR